MRTPPCGTFQFSSASASCSPIALLPFCSWLSGCAPLERVLLAASCILEDRGMWLNPARLYYIYIYLCTSPPHPRVLCSKDGVDVDNFLADKQVYTREYLESVRPLHRAPTTVSRH